MPNRRQTQLLLALGGTSLATGVKGQALAIPVDPVEPGSGWTFHDATDEGIKTYTRAGPGRLRTFLGVMQVQASPAALVAVLLDRDNAQRWSYRVDRVETLEGSTATHGHARMISKLPFPLEPRETIYEWKLYRDARTGEIILAVENRPRLRPLDPSFVRVQNMASTWQFSQLANGETKVRFFGYADLGGTLSTGIAQSALNTALSDAPLRTLEGLRKIATQSPYRDAALPPMPTLGGP
jgi:hypothetical protein